MLNFRAAARAAGMTPAALGQRIQKLEEQLDRKLFHRTTRSVVLTEEGLALVPYASAALDAARDCMRAGRGEVGPPPMEVTIGTRHELGLSWLVPLLPTLREQHPGMTIHLYFGSGSDLVLRVRTLQIDCAVTSTVLTDPKLDSARLHEEKYAFVAAPSLLDERPFTEPAHAKHHTLIDTTEELPLFRYWRNAPGGVDSLQFDKVRRMGTIAAIRHIVLQGAGVAVLPHYFVAEDLSAKRLARVFSRVKPLSDHFRLVFRADDPRRSAYESLAAAMLEAPLR